MPSSLQARALMESDQTLTRCSGGRAGRNLRPLRFLFAAVFPLLSSVWYLPKDSWPMVAKKGEGGQGRARSGRGDAQSRGAQWSSHGKIPGQ